MAKVSLDLVKEVLQRNGVDARKLAEMLNEMKREAESEAVEREKPVKKHHVVLVSSPDGGLPDDLVGWVVQVPEDDNPKVAVERIKATAERFNASPRGKKLPLSSFGDACQSLPTKQLKENQVWVKTRDPVRVLAIGNAWKRART
jgi:aspartokinase